MGGDLDAALATLAAAASAAASKAHDRVAIGMLRAELLDLALCGKEALELFDAEVRPHRAELDPGQQFAVDQNRSDLCLGGSLHDGIDDFYHLVDRKRLAGFDWFDYRDLFEAHQEVQQGKHHRALPTLWQQLRRAYAHGCWRAVTLASRYFAAECLALDNWADATHHAVMFQADDDFIRSLADDIVGSRQVAVVREVVGRLLTRANLRRHFVVAARLLKNLADVIPDDLVPTVGEWLLPRAAESMDVRVGPDPIQAAWEAVGPIAGRFPKALARRWLATATHHPFWTTKLSEPDRVIVGRRPVIDAVLRLAWAVPVTEAGRIADAAVPLALDRREDYDYAHVVNLLANLARRGGPRVATRLGKKLFPKGQPIDIRLAQAAADFGKAEIFTPDSIERFARRVEQNVRLQVQRIGPGEEAQRPDEMLYEFTQPIPEGLLKVFAVPSVGLGTLIAHRERLPAASVVGIVQAILAAAQDRDNFCNNRYHTLLALRDIADRVPAALVAEIIRVLEPLARGAVEESAAYATADQEAHPLNPTCWSHGGPELVQGAAVVALGALAPHHPRVARLLTTVLEDTLCDPRAFVREASYAAVRELSKVSEGVLLGLLAGLRDPDPAAAQSAFSALTSRNGWKFNRNHWRLFILAARSATHSTNARLRRHAAAAVKVRASACLANLAADLAALTNILSKDPSARVRAVISG
ncbi:MAG: hypothetical protein U0804_18250 [Gemmataceae bacterium]